VLVPQRVGTIIYFMSLLVRLVSLVHMVHLNAASSPEETRA